MNEIGEDVDETLAAFQALEEVSCPSSQKRIFIIFDEPEVIWKAVIVRDAMNQNLHPFEC
jgi:hypothetical protein